ncbi:MAG: hypothetical protein HYU70_13090 [Bacteroidetes bacterium]|nr:hypothetical protein [Bacteroidota bacterium]
MSYTAAIDASCFIWDQQDYQANTFQYLDLTDKLTTFIDIVAKEKSMIVIREELVNELVNGFPLVLLPDHFYEFGSKVYTFLAGIPPARFIMYAPNNTGVVSSPDIVKAHFNADTQQEVSYVLTYLHNKPANPASYYFTYEYIYGSNNDLETKTKKKTNTCSTVFFDDEQTLKNFFLQFKKIFEHNPKHHNGKQPGDKASPFRCYDGKNTAIPQDYLDRSFFDNNRYYFFDVIHEVYVVFFNHEQNKYHGHEESDLTKIPHRVRQHFNR